MLEIRFGWCGRPGVIEKVDDSEYGAQAARQLVNLGYAVRDSGRLDLSLGTHDTLRHRRFGYQEGSSDLLGRQAAEQPEGERHLCFRGECRVAARKDQPKPVVLHRSRLPG